MDIFKAAKTITSAASGIGASYIISDLTKAIMPENISKIGKIVREIGCFSLGGLVATATSNYTDKFFDAAKRSYNDIFNPPLNLKPSKDEAVEYEMNMPDLKEFITKVNEIMDNNDLNSEEKEVFIGKLLENYEVSK